MATLLVITTFLPLVGSLVLFLAPGSTCKPSASSIALGTVLATLAISLVLVAGFEPGGRAPSSRIGRRTGATASAGCRSRSGTTSGSLRASTA